METFLNKPHASSPTAYPASSCVGKVEWDNAVGARNQAGYLLTLGCTEPHDGEHGGREGEDGAV